MTEDNTKYYFSLEINHEKLGSFPCETRAKTNNPGEYSVFIISTVSEMIETHIPELVYYNSFHLDADLSDSEEWELIIKQFESEEAYETYTNFKCYHEYDDKIPRLNVTPFALENRLLLSVFKAHLKYEIKE